MEATQQPTDIIEVLTSRKGRRSKCTPEIIQEIGYSVAMGLSREDAAKLAGINRGSIYNWMSRGRDLFELYDGDRTDVPKKLVNYFDFFNTLEKAVPMRKIELMKTIAAHSLTNWQAGAWLLERQYPDEFARRTKVEITDWRSDLIELIKQGLDFDVISAKIGREKTKELFIKAGMDSPRE